MPQYKSLSMRRLAEFISGHPATHCYYPEGKESDKLPKQWIANVAYSVLGDTFSEWVKQQIEERNARVADQGNLMIELDPDVHAAFLQSTAVSRKCNAILGHSHHPFPSHSEPRRRRQHAQGRVQA